MKIADINEKDKEIFNKVVTHPLQSYEWGEFRKKTGVKVIRKGFFQNNKLISAFQLTIHHIPHTPWKIGYLPKGGLPSQDEIEELKRVGKEEDCIFIQLEPNIQISNFKFQISNLGLRPATHPLFTKYTFQLDLTQTEEELLKKMHPKTRYNIKIAQKHDVKVIEDNSNKAFKYYLDLTNETTNRQKFYAHTEKYHKLMWETLKMANGKWQMANRNNLTAHLLIANYHQQSAISYTPLVTWILFVFKDTLYYPYGASSSNYREVMASNLMMWEAIKFGKKLGLKKFDMWGSLGHNPDKNDKWYGFHRFKQGYGGELIEFIGSYDLIMNLLLYHGYRILDKIRWFILKFKR